MEQYEKSGDFTRENIGVSNSLEKDYVDDSKSILAVIKGEDIDITSDSDNDEDELEILETFALAFAKDEKSRARDYQVKRVNPPYRPYI